MLFYFLILFLRYHNFINFNRFFIKLLLFLFVAFFFRYSYRPSIQPINVAKSVFFEPLHSFAEHGIIHQRPQAQRTLHSCSALFKIEIDNLTYLKNFNYASLRVTENPWASVNVQYPHLIVSAFLETKQRLLSRHHLYLV